MSFYWVCVWVFFLIEEEYFVFSLHLGFGVFSGFLHKYGNL